MPTDRARLLVQAQSTSDPDHPARRQLWTAFAGLLHTLAVKACQLNRLPLGEVDDVVADALVRLLNPDFARFDPTAPSANLVGYLDTHVKNAAAARRRSDRAAAPSRHDYAHPDNARRHLPASPEAIPAPAHKPHLDARELAAQVMALAGPSLRRVLDMVCVEGRTLEEAGRTAGLDRRTVSRHLQRFTRRVAEQFASVLSG